ncbi:MAG: hypothetical protein ACRCTZ_11535 [Sarcina sp.]
MGNPEIKVLIEEISKLKSEIIEMKIEIESLKADIVAIGEVNKVSSELKVVGENSAISNGKFTLIKNQKINKQSNDKEEQVEKKKGFDKTEKKDLVKTEEIQKEIVTEVEANEIEKSSSENLKIDKNDIKIFRQKLKDVMKSEVRYDTWLKTGVENLSRTTKTDFVFPAANDFTRGIVEVRYKELVLEVLKAIFKNVTSVKIIALY